MTTETVVEPTGHTVGRETILAARNVTMRFGGLVAVDNVDFIVHSGEIVGLIGPNGAGKTTTFNMISGVVKPSSGTVHFDGSDITGHVTAGGFDDPGTVAVVGMR